MAYRDAHRLEGEFFVDPEDLDFEVARKLEEISAAEARLGAVGENA